MSLSFIKLDQVCLSVVEYSLIKSRSQIQLNAKYDWVSSWIGCLVDIKYLISLLRTLLLSLNVKSTLSSRYTYQYYRPSQSALLISLNIGYAPSLRCIYQHQSRSIIYQNHRLSRKYSIRSFSLPLSLLLVGLKPDMLIRQDLHILPILLLL